MRVGVVGGIVLVLVLAAIVLGYSSLFTIRRSRRWWFVSVSRSAW